jgi:hypothetical protein
MKTINIETGYKIQSKEEFTQWQPWSACFYYETDQVREEIADLKKKWPEIDFRIIEVVTTESVVDWP